MSVAENVKSLRLRSGMTQKELAEKVCVDQSMICQIERGTKVPTILLANEIAQALSCQLDDLIKSV